MTSHKHPGSSMDLFDPKPGSALEFLPPQHDLAHLAEASQGCHGCDLYRDATQTVFGEGHAPSAMLMVGEQPGDKEDLTGKPFVGPAGQLLDRCLAEAGIERSEVYITNAVKHFKWEPRGRIRLHKKPNSLEIRACRPWLEAEITAVQPQIIVCLGATAAQSLLGAQFRLTKQRGEVVSSTYGPALATVHPSAILRMPDPEAKAAAMVSLVSDLKVAAKHLSGSRR